MNVFSSVRYFHQVYGQLINEAPVLPDEKTRNLRKNLLKEEYEEYLEGEQNNDLVEIADALADMIYIICGTAVSYGIPLQKVFEEVHRSNLSKLDNNGKPIYREDGKILKSEFYTPPDVKGIIDEHIRSV